MVGKSVVFDLSMAQLTLLILSMADPDPNQLARDSDSVFFIAGIRIPNCWVVCR